MSGFLCTKGRALKQDAIDAFFEEVKNENPDFTQHKLLREKYEQHYDNCPHCNPIPEPEDEL